MYTIIIKDNYLNKKQELTKKSLMGVYSVIKSQTIENSTWDEFNSWASLNLAIFGYFTLSDSRYDVKVRSEK